MVFGRARRESLRQAQIRATAAAARQEIAEEEAAVARQKSDDDGGGAVSSAASDDEVIAEVPREPSEGDKVFYSQYNLLKGEMANAQGRMTPRTEEIAQPVAQSRGDGLWWECCRNGGFCICRRSLELVAKFGGGEKGLPAIEMSNMIKLMASTTDDSGRRKGKGKGKAKTGGVTQLSQADALKRFVSPTDLLTFMNLRCKDGNVVRNEFQDRCREVSAYAATVLPFVRHSQDGPLLIAAF